MIDTTTIPATASALLAELAATPAADEPATCTDLDLAAPLPPDGPDYQALPAAAGPVPLQQVIAEALRRERGRWEAEQIERQQAEARVTLTALLEAPPEPAPRPWRRWLALAILVALLAALVWRGREQLLAVEWGVAASSALVLGACWVVARVLEGE